MIQLLLSEEVLSITEVSVEIWEVSECIKKLKIMWMSDINGD